MSAKKRKHAGSPLRVIVILTLVGMMVYKYHSADENYAAGRLSEARALEIPAMQQAGSGGQVIRRTGYTLSYNADYKTPQWVAWELTREEAYGKEERADKFLPDPDVRGAKAYAGDYTRSGYDRGHMAPAADMKWDRQAMEESFYLSNICPQNGNLNRGDWNDLEEKCRQWAVKFGAIYIACGPIYHSKKPQRIGNNKVAVPDAFYKVIMVNSRKEPKAIGFVFANKAGHKPLMKYAMAVDSVEKITGIDFFPALSDETEKRIEADFDADEWSSE